MASTTPVRKVKIEVLFQGPGPQANGLAATNDGLWVCDQQDHRIYKIRYDGSIVSSFATPARNLSGCGFGGGSVWGASNIRPSAVTRHDPETGWCTQYIILPEGERGGVHGIEWHDGALWVTRPGFNAVQKINPDTGELLHQIPFPDPRNHGIFFKDGHAVVNETNHGNVYELDLADGRVVDHWQVEGFEAHGMTMSPDGRIWFCDATTNRIGIVAG
jgi:sugar lactone lactonase YvrE